MNPGPTILVVDFQSGVRSTLLTVLRHKGFSVQLAPDGASALRKAVVLDVGLFMIDLHLPDVSGIELCRHLKSRPAWANIPVAILSASYSDEDLQQAADAGAIAFISKPFDTGRLIDCIHRIWTQTTASFYENTLLPEADWLTLSSLPPGGLGERTRHL